MDALADRASSNREFRRGEDERLRTCFVVEALEGGVIARGERRRQSSCVDRVLLGEAAFAEGGPQLRATDGQRPRVGGPRPNGLLGQTQADGDLGDGGALSEVDAIATHSAGGTAAGIVPRAVESGVGTDPGSGVEGGVVEDRQNQAVLVGSCPLPLVHDALEVAQPRIDVRDRGGTAVERG